MSTDADDHEQERRAEEHERRLAERLGQAFSEAWTQIRSERRAEPVPVPVRAGRSNFNRAQVPWGVDLAAAWSWRLLLIAAGVYAVAWVFAYFRVVTLPLVVALLVAALANPLVRAAGRAGVPRGLSAAVATVGFFGVVGGLLTFVGNQVAEGASDLAAQVVDGLDKIRVWLREGPVDASDSQINAWIKQVQDTLSEYTGDGELIARATEVGTALGHLVAGLFIVLFATYFFLADGDRIWSWVVRLAPRAARERFDTSGRVAWYSLTQFVRATVLVALVDALGIMLVAWLLGVPLVLPIGVLVFLGAFVPLVGATVTGAVAVLVALVAQGPVDALLMLLGVVVVQQVESNVLQPFLMGRFVSVHPLGVIVAIGCGILVAGVAGALVAVPLVAVVNAVVQHLASYGEEGDGVLDELEPDESPPADDGQEAPA